LVDRGDGLADETHHLGGEHGLVTADEAVRELAGHVVGGDDRLDTVDGPRAGQVDADDARVRVWRTQRGAPQEAVGGEVARELERTLHLADTVGPSDAVAEATA
jgi:hypothetical protein